MSNVDRSALLAERNFLTAQIAKMPSAAALTRRSLESRLRSVVAKLEKLPVDVRTPAKALLTFKGKPVVGSHGVLAQFGTDATRAFTDAVAAVAASLKAPLAAVGPIPNRNRLLITGTALGSFGFELEESAPQAEGEEDSPVEMALERTQELLANSVDGTDEQLAETVGIIDPRALEKVRGFLQVLNENDATCTIAAGRAIFSFQNADSVTNSLVRLNAANVQEEALDLVGNFVGILTQRRNFEFREEGQQDVIYGKISTLIDEPGLLTGHWGSRFRVQIMRTQVGNGRPSFTLLRADRVPEDPLA